MRLSTGLVGEQRLATLEAECARLLPADGEEESCIVMRDIEGSEFCLG